MGFVFDIGFQDVETISLARERRGDGGKRTVFGFGDIAGRTRGIVPVLRDPFHVADDLAALAECGGLAHHGADVFELRALHAQQLMADAQEMFADDIEARFGQQVMDIGDAAVQRILHRNDAEIGIAGAHRFHRVLESGLGDRLHMRQRLARGEIGISARLPLESHAFGAFDQCPAHLCPSNLRAFSRSAGVSTLSGTLSTRATLIVIPASSARNCSSFSRNSSGDGGSATKRARLARRKA